MKSAGPTRFPSVSGSAKCGAGSPASIGTSRWRIGGWRVTIYILPVHESAEVVIVGGGVMGASVAYHLTTLGVTDILLLERNELASGSTSKSAGGIRAQFADEL